MSANGGNGSLIFGSIAQNAPAAEYTASEGLRLQGLDFQLGAAFADINWPQFSVSRFIDGSGASLYIGVANNDVTQSLQLRHDFVEILNDDSAGSGKIATTNFAPGTGNVQGFGNPGGLFFVNNFDSVNSVILMAPDDSFSNPEKNSRSVISAGQSDAIPGLKTNLTFASGVDPVTPIVPNENDFIWQDASYFDDNASTELMRLTRDGSLLIGTNTLWGPGVARISHMANDYYPALVVETDMNFDNYITMVIRGRGDQLYINTSDDFANIILGHEPTNSTLAVFGSSHTSNRVFIRADNGLSLDFEGTAGNIISRLLQTGDFTLRGRMLLGSALVTNVPGATLELTASNGSAGSGPLKFNAGTNLAALVNGVMEFDGANLYFTVGGVRKTVVLV